MSNMGTRTTSNALLNLWQIANNHMDAEQTAWFTSLTDFARMEAENIASTLQTLANLAASVGDADQPTNQDMVEILYSASYQVATLAALIEIAGDAQGRWEEMQAKKHGEEKPS